ncbi:MAG: prenyltransferase/squalene oxidase repeat-containing protein, partial [Planctomycetota bacterium]
HAAASAPPAPARPAAAALPAPAAPAPPADAPPPLARTTYQNRFGDAKLRALEEFGGSAETERAVAAGLAYLARIQDESGFWGERADFDPEKYGDVRIGKTGLALLAFLGAGHTPGGASQHAARVRRAVAFLAGEQHENGHFGDGSAYDHGIAAFALAECFAMTRDPALAEPVARATAWILAQQQAGDNPRFAGGWGYYFADEHVWNDDRWPRVSVTAWQVMALASARLGGLEVPANSLTAAGLFLAQAWDPRRGAFRYSHDPDRLRSGYPILPASTPAALFALSVLGLDAAAPELAPARAFVLDRAPRGYQSRGEDAFVREAAGNLYFWYYGTLALFRAGGNAWRRWNLALQETLLPAQAPDGSWPPICVYARYAGDDEQERTYTTAMCVLSLEVYYRYFTPLLKVR